MTLYTCGLVSECRHRSRAEILKKLAHITRTTSVKQSVLHSPNPNSLVSDITQHQRLFHLVQSFSVALYLFVPHVSFCLVLFEPASSRFSLAAPDQRASREKHLRRHSPDRPDSNQMNKALTLDKEPGFIDSSVSSISNATHPSLLPPNTAQRSSVTQHALHYCDFLYY